MLVEDHPAGYPRFAALIGAHPSFHIVRRFSTLRTRLLLDKQDRLSLLEGNLATLDAEELRPLFLGARRRDRNQARNKLLHEIDEALKDYGLSGCSSGSRIFSFLMNACHVDDLVERNEAALKREAANQRNLSNVQHWLDNSGCIARDETAYLLQEQDLMTVGASVIDEVPGMLQAPLEDAIIWISKTFKMRHNMRASRDPNVHILPDELITNITRAILTLFLIAIIFIPVSIILFLDSLTKRLGIIMLASIIFVFVLSMVGKAKTADLFMAGATYATILVAFIAQA